MTKIIGLTGGIGSGKTAVAEYFRASGIPVYIADTEAKKISESAEIVQLIKSAFGTSIFDAENINREKLAQLVFNDSEKLATLNKIIHPAVKIHFENWVKNHKEFPYVIKEAAILFESGSYKDCDIIITVVAPLETRISRVLGRDKTSRENVLKRIDSQWTDDQRVSKSDYVIENISLPETQKQVDKILKKLTIR